MAHIVDPFHMATHCVYKYQDSVYIYTMMGVISKCMHFWDMA